MKSSIYGTFGKHLTTIVDGSFTMYHTNFSPHPPAPPISFAPVTEVITCYFTSHSSDFETNALKLVDVVQKEAEGFRGSASGWVIEDVEHESFGEGKKGKAWVAVLGWDSVEAHMKFRETEAFKQNIHLLREGPVKMEVHHTKFVTK